MKKDSILNCSFVKYTILCNTWRMDHPYGGKSGVICSSGIPGELLFPEAGIPQATSICGAL
jgi:hypothetical protein